MKKIVFILAYMLILGGVYADILQYQDQTTHQTHTADTHNIINSDYGPRNKSDSGFVYDYHGGIDYNIDQGDHILSVVDGTIKKIFRNTDTGLIYVAIESPNDHHYAYVHLFPDNSQTPVINGNFVFTPVDSPNNDRNAILYFGVTPPKVYVDADNISVTYNNITYTSGRPQEM